ncbi:MAG: rhomboid family intramembrane serine protease [Terriglobales bacterium]
MARDISNLGFPPLRGAVRQIIIASAAIYVVILLLMAFAPAAGQSVLAYGVLDPVRIRQGWLWQLVTYAFMYVDPLDFVLSLLGVYFLGWAVEDRVGSARLYGLFFGSIILSALAGCALSLTRVVAQGPAYGSGAAANAILMVFYMFNRGAPIMLFPIPIQIPVKWIVIFIAAIETAYLLLNHFALLYFIELLGLGAGYIWYLAFFTRRLSRTSKPTDGLRNAYYRWKRRRAARKFEVYMRKHDRKVTFDEHGNYVPPEEDQGGKKNGGSKSGWVN